MNLKLILFVFTISVVPFSLKAEFKCDAEVNDYAREVVELELAGLRATKRSSCLKQTKFKYVRVSHDPINELMNQKFYYANPETLVIDRVKKIHDKKRHYRVEFSIEAGEKNNAMNTQTGSLIFFQNDDKEWGCAHLLFPPEDIYVAANCL
jgi:hypothetical protein